MIPELRLPLIKVPCQVETLNYKAASLLLNTLNTALIYNLQKHSYGLTTKKSLNVHCTFNKDLNIQSFTMMVLFLISYFEIAFR